jgi:uncharacterized protein YciI
LTDGTNMTSVSATGQGVVSSLRAPKKARDSAAAGATLFEIADSNAYHSRQRASRRSCRGVKKLTGLSRARLQEFVARGDVIGIGPFSDRSENLAISAVAQDRFILEGLIESYDIRDWADQMLE